MGDSLSSQLAFFGRVTDDFRREPAWAGEYRILLGSPPREALYKSDGHFAFLDLAPSPAAYDFRLVDGLYQGRRFSKLLPTGAPVEVTYGGEDEIYVFAKTVNTTTKRITFDAIPFLPIIRQGAPVLGAGGLSTTLAEDLAGVDVAVAALSSVTGVGVGDLVRIVRSRCLRGKAGPYYPFPSGLTLLSLKIVEDGAGEPPLAGATAHLAEVNGNLPSSTTVAGVALRHLPLGGPVLGTDADLDAVSEARGNAVFYFPGTWSLTSLQVVITCAGFVPQTHVVALTAGKTTALKVKLVAA